MHADFGVRFLVFLEVEQLRYQLSKLITVAVDAQKLVVNVVGELARMQQRLGQSDDNCERSPDFMRHIRKETDFRLVAFFDVYGMYFLIFQRLCQSNTLAITAHKPHDSDGCQAKIEDISPP